MVVKTIEVDNFLKKKVSTTKNGEGRNSYSKDQGQPNQIETQEVFTAFDHEKEMEIPYPQIRGKII